MIKDVNKKIEEISQRVSFSGVVLINEKNNIVYEEAYGFANRSDRLENKIDTKFGIASGCKLFTAIAICQLVDAGKLSFETKLVDCLPFSFPKFDTSITIHHLLTHSSGVPDYFDEEVMDDFEELWVDKPMYTMKRLEDFLPFFQNRTMSFSPGTKFQYNNSGFILLGLAVEQVSGLSFSDYIDTHVFKVCDMKDSGYYSLDSLPKNTAIGYIDSEKDGTWRSNIYSLPIKGGADGGAFTTAHDMVKLWDGLLNGVLLSKPIRDLLLTPHIQIEQENYYGYGIWIDKRRDQVFKYHVMGYDPGVSFASSYYPGSDIKIVIPSNQSYGPHDITAVIEETLLD
ncbi:serine hydrolase domain-containing protein [Bacillus alkalicellulosilyticus]|uniref:serine hydrolase domain-containing protein n=1 Tax=Alkalihalobacterium alkalicellulosilyticum TaxID=1912214 RepID=UPI000998B138|nr:serine hydrolase [Bacillus alkalicellulosilyticus]